MCMALKILKPEDLEHCKEADYDQRKDLMELNCFQTMEKMNAKEIPKDVFLQVSISL